VSRSDRARELRGRITNAEQACRKLGFGDRLQRQRNGILTQCPLHGDRTPSFSFTTGADGTLRYHCFGCGEKGDVLTLIAKLKGLDPRRDFRAVLDAAAELAGLPDMCASAASGVDLPIDDAAYSTIATDLAELCPLERQNDGIHYVAQRGLLPGAAEAGLFVLPRPGEQHPVIAELIRLHGADAVERAGWLWRNRQTGALDTECFAFTSNRLCIPWREPGGKIQAIQRRRLNNNEPRYVFARGRAARYPFGIEKLAASATETPVAFTEGAFDAIALRLLVRRRGRDVLVLGLPGLEGWRPGWAKLAKGREAFIALDADAAGERKREPIVADLFAAGATMVRRLTPKGGKDWAEILQRGAQ
jgi:hypothetical protein